MSGRQARINESVREVLGEAITHLSDPRIGFLTITSVEVAKDMKTAKVFYTVLGNEGSRAQTAAALMSSQGILQRAVAREAKLRNTPQLKFTYDDTTDTAIRINRLLEEHREQ